MKNATPTPEEFAALLHSRGQRATPQRFSILRTLRERGRHATAEEIGCAVRAEMPGTSVPTVYATLDLLVELGFARRIDTGMGPALYDGGTEPHQHTVCRQCGQVEDVEGNMDAAMLLQTARQRGFRPDSAELVISGICRRCAA